MPVQVLDSPPINDDQLDQTPIQEFYRNKKVLLTGGTGFFGKIIVEKLLRVTDVEHIYLLIRNKKGKDVYTRIDELFDDPLFALLKSQKPKYRHNISVISGDVSLPGMGISHEERQTIRDNVNVVIHGAATVRFDEKLKMAIAINVNGTKEIIKLCREIKDLKAVVHVSTAFANCNYRHIEEKFYKPRISAVNACCLSDCLDEKTLNEITPIILKDYPNTYTFTKVLAEDVVKNAGQDLPIVILRPGIVISTYQEPIPGWIDNMYGPCGINVGAFSGVFRVFYANLVAQANVVPVDLCVNCLLASAWDISENKEKYTETPIYNYIPDEDNTVTWNKYLECGFKYGREAPLSKTLWFPTFTVTSSELMFKILTFFYHLLPAFLIDTGLTLIGKKPQYLQIYRKVHKFCNVMTYFSQNEWTFTNDNTRRLWASLTSRDKKLFAFEMRVLNWDTLFQRSIYGLRQYVVKEDPLTIPNARRRWYRYRIYHNLALAAIYIMIIYYVYSKLLNFF